MATQVTVLRMTP